VRSFIDISDIKRLLAEQQVNIDLAKQVLRLVNAGTPRHIDLADGCGLFVESFSVSCKAAGGDHCFVRALPEAGEPKTATVLSVKDQSGHEVNCVLRSIVTDLFHHVVLSENHGSGLSETTQRLNELLCRTEFFPADDYVTGAVVRIDHASLVMQYACCGHPPILIVRGSEVMALPADGAPGHNLPLAFLPEIAFSSGQFNLRIGDKVLLYTDGLTAMTLRSRGCPMPTDELVKTLQGVVDENPRMSVTAMISNLLGQLGRLGGEAFAPFDRSNAADDITLLGLEIEPRPAYQEVTLFPRSVEDLSERIVHLSDQIGAQWAEEGFQDPDQRVRLFLEEAIRNAWKHAHQKSPTKPIRVRWWKQNDFMCEVMDEGNGFNPESVPDPRTPRRRQEESGRGVFLIKRATDEVRWLDGGRRVVGAFAPGLHPSQNRTPNTLYAQLKWWK
jgi:anti-sigma regulatory factor (Ser/Thr protein kinase)/serine phosphatase RsbU (regulator of sigma subunit)